MKTKFKVLSCTVHCVAKTRRKRDRWSNTDKKNRIDSAYFYDKFFECNKPRAPSKKLPQKRNREGISSPAIFPTKSIALTTNYAADSDVRIMGAELWHKQTQYSKLYQTGEL